MWRRWLWQGGAAVVAAGCFGGVLHAQVGPGAKACSLLPIADLEAHFGAKATPPKGSDLSTVSTCAANFPDIRHTASVNIRPPSAGDQTVGIDQRIAVAKSAAGQGKSFESQVFGSVGCFRVEQEQGGKPLPAATCFQVTGGYLALTVGSDDPKQVSFELVRDLLRKAAVNRK